MEEDRSEVEKVELRDWDDEIVETEEYFGGCPECGRTDGFLNVGRSHWFICKQHKTKWCVGSNLFSSWRYESEVDWERNRARLASYRKI